MHEPTPFALFLMLGLAIWGGTVNYLSRIKRGVVARFSVLELLSEWVISGFSGFLVWLLCQNFGIDEYLTAAFVGIAGHAGGRTVFILENAFNKQLDALANKIHKK